jgi:hypothetical protein
MIRHNILISGFYACKLLAIHYYVKSDLLTGVTIEMTVFLDVTSCKPVSHQNMLHQSTSTLKMEAVFAFKMFINDLPDYTASRPARQHSSAFSKSNLVQFTHFKTRLGQNMFPYHEESFIKIIFIKYLKISSLQ